MKYTLEATGEKKEYTGLEGLVREMLEQLLSYRGKTGHPELLEFEIKVYQYILISPEIRYHQYCEARFDFKAGFTRTKQEAIQFLGWEI